jgi:hypothetical protein
VSYSIVIANVDTTVPAAEVALAAAAIQRQVLEHLFPCWGISASVRSATASNPPRDDEWVLQLRRSPVVKGVLGIHRVTDFGVPLMLDFPELDARDGVAWTATASHEILETLTDPWLRRGAQDDHGAWWATEICDPVDADTYRIDGIAVSNFCLPAWSEPPPVRAGIRYDYMGLCSGPWNVRKGGYAHKFDPKSGSWMQVGEMRSARRALHGLGLGRASRR